MEIYQRPRSTFTAAFIGHANIFLGRVTRIEPDCLSVTSEGGLEIHVPPRADLGLDDGVMVAVKQERVRFMDESTSPNAPGNAFPAVLLLVSFLGPTIDYVCRAAGHDIHVRRPNEGRLPDIAPGQHIRLAWEPVDCVVIPRT